MRAQSSTLKADRLPHRPEHPPLLVATALVLGAQLRPLLVPVQRASVCMVEFGEMCQRLRSALVILGLYLARSPQHLLRRRPRECIGATHCRRSAPPRLAALAFLHQNNLPPLSKRSRASCCHHQLQILRQPMLRQDKRFSSTRITTRLRRVQSLR
jgi:hypothetical protein